MATNDKESEISWVGEHDQSLRRSDAQDLWGIPSLEGSKDQELYSILHDLNNVLVCVLVNVQIMARILPSYSVLKRNLHEVERSAQQGGLFVRRLRNWYRDEKAARAK